MVAPVSRSESDERLVDSRETECIMTHNYDSYRTNFHYEPEVEQT